MISLQVAGSKRWLVYEPVLELPLKNQRYARPSGAGRAMLDVTLRGHDTLYLPRGWLHQALTSDEDSLHITVGINVRRWVDEARAELDVAENDLAFRQTIDAEGRRSCPRSSRDGAGTGRHRFVRSRRPILDGQLASCSRARELTADDELERRDTVIADLDGTTLVFEGEDAALPGATGAGARVPRHHRGTVPRLRASRRLDEAGRLVLVRRLVREGFLRRGVSAG